jgi:hypothetical protein
VSHRNPLSPRSAAATRRPVRLLVLAGLSLTVAASVLGRTLGVLCLTLAASALGAAAALGLRSPRTPAPALLSGPPSPSSEPVALDVVDDGELTTRLARLHEDHVEQANSAVGEGRDDLLQELSDSYLEQAMALMTGAGLPPARAAQQVLA